MPAQSITLFAKWDLFAPQVVSLGSGRSSAIDDTGRVFIWGRNANGTFTKIPNEITSNFSLAEGDKIISLSLGKYYSDNYGSHSSALSATGRVFMWGYNISGVLGDGTITSRYLPTEITSRFSLAEGDKIISLSLGGYHSSALSATGRVFMWGSNIHGQIGDGTNSNSRNVPTEITSRFSLAEGDKIISLSLGHNYSSALSATGRVFMWGENWGGQIGDGTTTSRYLPTEITSRFSLAEGDMITSLSIGSYHSSALSATGRVFMWGYNNYGQLGDGTITSRYLPTEITSRFSLAESDKIISLSLGLSHSSALSATGRVFMWGSNYYGQIADGTVISNDLARPHIIRDVPTEITSRFSLAEGDKIISLSLGYNDSSALSATGRVFMWGENWGGQTGYPYISVPVQI
jgi:alpha-tubulin suppressor-like RCC1 family protein